MRIIIGFAIAAAGMTAAGQAHAQNTDLLVYPAMRHAGAAYAIRTGVGGKIVDCQPLETKPDAAALAAACAALTAKGVPATVVPARATNDPSRWVDYGDYPRNVTNRAKKGTVQLVYEINETGRVSTCQVFETSGEDAIDNVICASITARARFAPATYKGSPVSAIGTNFVSYDIPGI
ncbi:MAG: TonB family protein [Pseudomonadota bacterium]